MNSNNHRNGYALGLVAALATTVLIVMGSLAQALALAQIYA